MSTKRRFTFSLEFNPMTEETLRDITKSKLSDIQMNDKMRSEITDLCSKYKKQCKNYDMSVLNTSVEAEKIVKMIENAKRFSDIMNCYVGESEKNIARAFREAEASGDILLFDEADSFFSDRENANYSWERNAVNEFLTQMEEFSGVLICTTNLKQILDPAINRRKHYKRTF